MSKQLELSSLSESEKKRLSPRSRPRLRRSAGASRCFATGWASTGVAGRPPSLFPISGSQAGQTTEHPRRFLGIDQGGTPGTAGKADCKTPGWIPEGRRGKASTRLFAFSRVPKTVHFGTSDLLTLYRCKSRRYGHLAETVFGTRY
jgi:hypothetical protein